MCWKLACLLPWVALNAADLSPRTVRLNDDGGWCWFQDERSVVVNGRTLIVGTVASGFGDARRRGDVDVTSFDLQTGDTRRFTLHHSGEAGARVRWLDDHNSPALLVRPDGRLLALYSQHGLDEKIYYRISTRPGDISAWDGERVFVPSPSSRVTYSNLLRLSRENSGHGRTYDFFRGLDNSFKPSFAFSDDDGATWMPGNVVIEVPARVRHRPYVKYASDGRETIHLAYTEGHPRDFDNSVYHVVYRGGALHRSDGSVIRGLREGLRAPEEGTRVFAGDAQNVAWVSDLHIDPSGRPYLAYSVQKNSGGKPTREHGGDHRYRYARWDGSRWLDFEIAYAGHQLYPGEDDYTGNLALDPRDPSTVIISTNADPATGAPLQSAADGRRHWEIFRGRTQDGGRTWRWEAVTRDSRQDQIRPIIPNWESRTERAVLWLRGTMRTYTDFEFEVVARVEAR